YFFFQAEDGIRDFHVTGVQTCALPICRQRPARRRPAATAAGRRRGNAAEAWWLRGRAMRPRGDLKQTRSGEGVDGGAQQRGGARSEERRVGKEGGPRGGPEPERQSTAR